jgi:hypothetical protein
MVVDSGLALPEDLMDKAEPFVPNAKCGSPLGPLGGREVGQEPITVSLACVCSTLAASPIHDMSLLPQGKDTALGLQGQGKEKKVRESRGPGRCEATHSLTLWW